MRSRYIQAGPTWQEYRILASSDVFVSLDDASLYDSSSGHMLCFGHSGELKIGDCKSDIASAHTNDLRRSYKLG